jgi:carbamoylphosphate synthase small subunit
MGTVLGDTSAATIPTIDSVATRTLEQAVRFYGIRAVLFALEAITERRAEKSVENFNTVQAKQWARWAVELECLCGSSKLTDPGRE